MFKRDFHPDSGHELFKKPPALHQSVKVQKYPASWDKNTMLNAKQWAVLIQWCTDWFEALASEKPEKRVVLAQVGRAKKGPKGQRIIGEYEIEPCDLASKYCNAATIAEAWQQATNRRFSPASTNQGESDA